MKRPENLDELIDFKKIQEIYDMCFQIQTKGIATVFVRFSGHINGVEIDIYYGGWIPGRNGETKSFHVSKKGFCQDQVNDVIAWLKEVLNSSVSYEDLIAKRLEKEKERKRQQYEALKAEFESES